MCQGAGDPQYVIGIQCVIKPHLKDHEVQYEMCTRLPRLRVSASGTGALLPPSCEAATGSCSRHGTCQQLCRMDKLCRSKERTLPWESGTG